MGAQPKSLESIAGRAVVPNDPRTSKSLLAVHPVRVEALRPDEADLRWYFCTDPEEPLLQSGYAALVRRLVLKSRDAATPITPAGWELARDRRDRWSRVASILGAIPAEDAEVLALALGPELAVYPKQFGHLGRLVAAIPHTAIAHRRSKSKQELREWFSVLLIRAEWQRPSRAIVTHLLAHAQARYRQALLAYREGKRRTGLTGREESALRVGQGGRHV